MSHTFTTHSRRSQQTLTLGPHTQVFCLVMSSGFLYKWHVYLKGADPLKGANMMYRLIHDELLSESVFEDRGCVVAMDAAFTSVKLFKVRHHCIHL